MLSHSVFFQNCLLHFIQGKLSIVENIQLQPVPKKSKNRFYFLCFCNRIADIPLPSNFTFLFSSWNFSHHFSALSLVAFRMLVEMRYTSHPDVINEMKINTAYHLLSAYFLSHSVAPQCNITSQPFLPVWEPWTEFPF